MTQPNLLELAKQGNVNAIASLLNNLLQPKGITTTAILKDSCLQLMLEAAQVPDRQVLVGGIRQLMTSVEAASIERVKIYGRQTGTKIPAWSLEFELAGKKLPLAEATAMRTVSDNEGRESHQLSIKEQAKLGDVDAIATLLSISLQNKNITATATLQDGCLQVMLESDVVPEEEVSVRIIRRDLTNLKADAIESVKVYGQQAGEDFPAWNREFKLGMQTFTKSTPVSFSSKSSATISKPNVASTEEGIDFLFEELKNLNEEGRLLLIITPVSAVIFLLAHRDGLRIVIVLGIVAWLTAIIAKKKGRKFLTWFSYGFLLPVFALIHAAILK